MYTRGRLVKETILQSPVTSSLSVEISFRGDCCRHPDYPSPVPALLAQKPQSSKLRHTFTRLIRSWGVRYSTCRCYYLEMDRERPSINLLHADPAKAGVAVEAHHLVAAAQLLDRGTAAGTRLRHTADQCHGAVGFCVRMHVQ